MIAPLSETDPFRDFSGDLESFADLVSEILQCPITIEDANHRLISYSTHDDRTDQARITTIIGRRVPEKVINSLWKDGAIPALIKSDEPVRINSISAVGLGNRVAISIKKNQEILGFIWALEIDHTLKADDLVFLKKAAFYAKNLLLQHQTRKSDKKEGHQEFFWKLLTGHLHSEEEIRKKFQTSQIYPPSLISVIVFQFPEPIEPKLENQISYLLKITQQIKIIFYTIDYSRLILLASPFSMQQPTKDINNFIAAFIEKMKERYKTSSIIGGFGTIYSNYEKIAQSYKEALAVIEIKEKLAEETPGIYNYQDLGIYQYIDLISEKRRIDGFENQSLVKLREYDKTHDSQLTETLEMFINKDSNINEAAKVLHVHVNTLNYRLKRISEIGDINLKDPHQKIALFIEMKIDKLRRKGLL